MVYRCSNSSLPIKLSGCASNIGTLNGTLADGKLTKPALHILLASFDPYPLESTTKNSKQLQKDKAL